MCAHVQSQALRPCSNAEPVADALWATPNLWVPSHAAKTMSADCQHAVQQLLFFLRKVGPVEAAWAMSVALAELQALPAGLDHVNAVELAFLGAPDEVAPSAQTEVKAEVEAEALSSKGRHKSKPVEATAANTTTQDA